MDQPPSIRKIYLAVEAMISIDRRGEVALERDGTNAHFGSEGSGRSGRAKRCGDICYAIS